MGYFEDFMEKIGWKEPLKVLFVCSGNICRSAYAEFVFRKMVKESPILSGKIEVRSAALQFKNREIDPRTVRVLEEEGFDPAEVKKHIPRHKEDYPELFEEADIIIGMTGTHRVLTPKKYRKGPDAKFIRLAEIAADEKKDIEDPYFKESYDEYRNILKDIRGYLEKLRDRFEKFYGG